MGIASCCTGLGSVNPASLIARERGSLKLKSSKVIIFLYVNIINTTKNQHLSVFIFSLTDCFHAISTDVKEVGYWEYLCRRDNNQKKLN